MSTCTLCGASFAASASEDAHRLENSSQLLVEESINLQMHILGTSQPLQRANSNRGCTVAYLHPQQNSNSSEIHPAFS